jgi:hypothetical protein
MKKARKRKAQPGPTPETLKIEGDWKDAVKKALRKTPPAKGWPKPEPKKKKSEG